MEKTNFWHDASKYGALLGIEEIAFNLLSMVWPGMLNMLLHLAVFITLLFLFTKRRAALYGGGASGYSYGQCFKFILVISIFAGILCGVYEIFARNVFFTAQYQSALDVSMNAVLQLNLPGSNMGQMQEMMQRVMFSPFWILFGSILGLIIKGGFWGLFVAAFAKRDPSPFAEDNGRE